MPSRICTAPQVEQWWHFSKKLTLCSASYISSCRWRFPTTQDVEKAIKKGNREGAQIYAQNAIREKTQAMNYLRLSSRLDAVASRLETAIRTKQISASMGRVVSGMHSALASMDPVQISATMEDFEKQFETMEVVTMTMEQTMDMSTATTTPAEEVDSLIQMVADQNNLELGSEFDSVAAPKTKVQAAEPAAGEYFFAAHSSTGLIVCTCGDKY
jgi:charged multivesicular body protein 1